MAALEAANEILDAEFGAIESVKAETSRLDKEKVEKDEEKTTLSCTCTHNHTQHRFMYVCTYICMYMHSVFGFSALSQADQEDGLPNTANHDQAPWLHLYIYRLFRPTPNTRPSFLVRQAHFHPRASLRCSKVTTSEVAAKHLGCSISLPLLLGKPQIVGETCANLRTQEPPQAPSQRVWLSSFTWGRV